MGRPDTTTGSVDPQIVRELREREPLFHTGHHVGRAGFEESTSSDFWEVGASGQCYDREQVWAVLAERRTAADAHADDATWTITEFAVQAVGGDVWLVTYRLDQGARVTRRLTAWERVGSGWRAVYHQGTVVASDEAAPGRPGWM